MIFVIFLQEKNVYSELEQKQLKKQVPFYTKVNLYAKTDEEVFKRYQAITLLTTEFDCLPDDYSKVKKRSKPQLVK